MKQKIVIKVCMCCDKCRSKALKIAAVADGVISVAIEGADRDRVVVIGEGVDAANLTCRLRKKVNNACLISVDEVKPPKPKDDPPPKKPCPSPCKSPPCCVLPAVACYPNPPACTIYSPPCCELYKVVYDPNPPACTIM